ncbi:MAG TPA: hypothetical protein VH280_15730 [Verrucomicrobiae bacterium]|jgi:hypothetical protein|nr:hypothetical protein [Verrucomicrobiae bacterium]
MALRNAVNAALQRVPIYADGVTSDQRRQFREFVKQWLARLGFRYFAWEYDATRYCDEIITLQQELTRQFQATLRAGTITVGVCQKPISLYLKYLWLYNDSGKKPFFPPLDRGVLQETNAPGTRSFPQIATIKDYRTICDHIDVYAKSRGFGSGAVWEAEFWTDEQDDEA